MDASIATEPPCCRARNMTTPEPYLFVGEQPSDAYCVLSAESIRGEIVDYIPEYQAIEIWRFWRESNSRILIDSEEVCR